tara:strand:+ start:213 stop:473 length:261 start_codon:yes stop_codon:yes gene_type:complete
MTHKVNWQKVFDIESEIELIGMGGETCEWIFKVTRREDNAFFEPEVDDITAYVEDGRIVDFDYEIHFPTEEEQELMEKILMEKNII